MPKPFLLLSLFSAFAQAGAAEEFTSLQSVAPTDSPEQIVAKAAHVIPSGRQLGYHRTEFISFIHFGPNTFTGKEWGNGTESPDIFAPTGLDTDQWCQLLKAAGVREVVMTFKHHDGYVLWQSRYEKRQTIKNSPFQGGKADIARNLSNSCKKYGLKFGVYISPADLYQIESKEGLYGNGSKYVKSSIPTDPDSFKTDPSKPRTDRPKGAPVLSYECDDYNRYMLNQLYELLTEYGPVHEVWFDGAHPKRKGDQTYTYQAWYELIRKLAPEAIIFGKGPDGRWCGNEAGGTRASEWNVLPLNAPPESNEWPDMTAADLGSREKLKGSKYLYYYPAETNTSIREGWFYRDDTRQTVRTADDVFDIYERSVGGNSLFMLNIPPNKEGRFSQRDADCLVEVGRRIRETYGRDLAKGGSVSERALQDGSIDTFWQPAGATGEIVVTLPKSSVVNRFLFQEAIGKQGQRIEKHALDAWVDGKWSEVAAGTTVGYKKILRFPSVTTDKFRLRILESRLRPTVAEVSAHFYDQPPLPVIANRNAKGEVLLSLQEPAFKGKGAGFKTAGLAIRYTLDGSEPTVRSTVYSSPLLFPNGGVLKARSFSSLRAGAVGVFNYGPPAKDWKAEASSAASAENDAAKAIDGNPATFWASGAGAHPHTFTLDLGKSHRLTALTYLPRQGSREAEGMMEQGKVQVSVDGSKWEDAGVFTFGNLLNDPSERTFHFERARAGRYVRILSVNGARGSSSANAAEIGVLTREEE